MKKLFQLGLLLSLLLNLSNANAALLIEPVLGYNVNVKSETEAFDISGVPVAKSSTSGGKGVGIGGRLGYQQLGFQVGLDFLKSTLDMNDSNYDEDLNTTEWAGFVGFEFPVLFRVYAGYIFAGEGKSENGGEDITVSGASGAKFGLGFTGIPFIDINIEYRRGVFDEMKIGSSKYKVDTNYSALMFALSVPFTI